MKQVMLLVLLLAGGEVCGQDRLFTYTYQSTVLQNGQKEIEVWNTFRGGKESYFARLDQRVEFEAGLGRNLQTAFYLNMSSKTALDSELESSFGLGFSNEWKIKVLDPVVHPVGLALYGEYGISSDEYELEGKLILDKRIDRLTIALNAVAEQEFKPEVDPGGLGWEKESKIELDLAFAWSFSPKFALTLESSARNILEDGSVLHSALYAGPGMSWSGDRIWVNFTFLPQLRSFMNTGAGSRDLDEFEKVQFRLLFSYVL